MSTDWLAEHLDQPELRILDCTVILEPGPQGSFQAISGRSRWQKEHVPGSAFADLLTDLADPDTSLRFMLPSADRFASAMGRLGVGVGTSVVLYDSRASMWATRLWWMLRAFGFDQAAVLDGGWTAWRAEGHPTTAEVRKRPPAVFHARPRPGLFVGRDQVLDAIDDTAACLVNALSPEQHRGEVVNYARPGHIPGSANVAAAGLVDPATQRFLPLEELRGRFGPVLERTPGRVITYCGGGIAASADAFTLLRLGLADVAVYDASLQEWAADPALPLEVGD